jgi:hypothetical protein
MRKKRISAPVFAIFPPAAGGIHKIFTEKQHLPLAFFAAVGYYMLALRQKEC